MKIKQVAQSFARKLTRNVHLKDLPLHEDLMKNIGSIIPPDNVNNFIGELLISGNPFMVARFGSGELHAVKLYRKMQIYSLKEKIADFGITGDWSITWPMGALRQLENNAGFFPANTKNVELFARLMIQSMASVDLLGSWVRGEGYFNNELSSAKICNLKDLDPYVYKSPWSQHLSGRKVLVIHPFSASIQSQYKFNREKLFKNPLILPEFKLETLTAIQSLSGNRPEGLLDWFSALDYMYEKALTYDVDVVILGCGAYGFPLAAKLKSAGKQVIHLGGSTQLLFGIKGRRWDNHPIISSLYNDYWVRPSADERPSGAEKVEEACYW